VNIFHDAVTGDDGRVDAGYLGLFWAMIVFTVSSGLVLLIGTVSAWRAVPAEVAAIIQSIGVAMGAIAVAFGTVVGAVGLFRAGDKPHATTQTTTIAQTTTTPPPAA
jgi:uncharacterized membrane protein (DUF485 family)